MIGAGAFVRFGGELGDVYEGFLPARRIRGERFEINETETALVGAPHRARRQARRPAPGPGSRASRRRAGASTCFPSSAASDE